MSAVDDFRHLTWRGKWEVLFAKVRGLFIAPAPMMDRCVMGSTIGPASHCPRPAAGDNLWCRQHDPERPPLRRRLNTWFCRQVGHSHLRGETHCRRCHQHVAHGRWW